MEFLYSDDPFSIFIFTVVMIVLFILLLNILMGSVAALMKNSQEYVIKGMIPASIPTYIPVNPLVPGSKPIERSDNKTGIEFSWSVWLNATDLDMNKDSYLHVFNKGEEGITTNGVIVPNNSPGVYLKADKATNSCELHVLMNTFSTGSTYYDEITVPNIPLNKWVNVIVRIMNNKFDVYVNGTLATEHILTDVPQQNYGSVNVGLNGGFSGYLSNLMYFSYGLSPGKIMDIQKRGPNLKLNSTAGSLYYAPNYLSSQWYSNNNNLIT